MWQLKIKLILIDSCDLEEAISRIGSAKFLKHCGNSIFLTKIFCQNIPLWLKFIWRREKASSFYIGKLDSYFFFKKWAKPGLCCLFLFFAKDKYSTNLTKLIKAYMVCLLFEPGVAEW